MTDQAFAQADPQWVELISLAREWFRGPLGQLMLKEEEKLLEEELGRFFGGYLVHYGPCAEAPPTAPRVQRNVRLGAPLPGVEIVCEEQAWPLGEHAADVVVLQHGLDFSLSPHGLLREAASAVRAPADRRYQSLERLGCSPLLQPRCAAQGALHSAVTGR